MSAYTHHYRRELASEYVRLSRLSWCSFLRLRAMGASGDYQRGRAQALMTAAWMAIGEAPLREKLAAAKWRRENGRHSTVVMPDGERIEVMG